MSCSLFATVTSNKCHISLNTECFCGTFLEPIPCMDMHLSTMLECKKCDWFLSQCNMSCSLLTTVTSNICQYLHQYWLFLWRFFWHVPIRHREGIWNVRIQIAWINQPQMKLVCSLSATVSNHISTKTRSFCGAFLDSDFL